MRTKIGKSLSCMLLGLVSLPGVALAQQGGPPGSPDAGHGRMGPSFGLRRPPLERALHVGPPGRWWDDPDFAKKIGLTTAQQKQMDSIFLDNRLKLIDLSANVEKQEAEMEPLLSSDQLDQKKVLERVDQLAEARASLEKANARMLLELRGVLTPDQWKQLQAQEPRGGHGERFGRPGPPSGIPPGNARGFHPD